MLVNLSFLIKWLLVFTIIANLVLGTIVFIKKPHSHLNRLFGGLTIVASLWTLCVFFIFVKDDYKELLFWIKISHAVAAFIPTFIYSVVYAFIYEKNFSYKKLLPIFLIGASISLLSLTNIFVEDLAFPLQNKEIIYGSLFPLYAFYFGGSLIFIVSKLFLQLRLSRGITRSQLRYFLGGILISFILGNLADLFLPLFSISFIDLRPFGPVFTLIMITSITYAIVKYRLMDVRIAIRKFMGYFLTILLVAAVYLSLMLSQERFRLYAEAKPFPFTLIAVLLVAILFQPLKDKVQSLVDRFFYRGAYDYYNALIDSGRAMVSILKMEELLNFLLDKVINTIHIEHGLIFLKKEDGSFVVAAQKSLQPFSQREGIEPLLPGNPLLVFLLQKRDVVLFADLKEEVKDKRRENLAAEMRRLQAEAVVPIHMDDKLEAILVLGFKISGEPYSREDVGLLSTLSYQISVSLRNARLYQEVLDIKEYLENILKNMGNGLLVVDGEGKITIFNAAAERMTGISARKALGRRAEEVLGEGFSAPLLQTLERGQPVSDEEVELRRGSHVSFLCCNTARMEPLEPGIEGKKRGAIMVLSEITRLKELEREKSQALRLASLGELAAGLAHEIKNPLVSIKTFAELLPGKYDDPEFRHSFSQIVGLEIERINKLIMELLNFSRIRGPKLARLDIKLLLEEIFKLISPQLSLQQISLKKRYRGDLPVILADGDQLKQALLNIFLNGIQAMPQGGELEVEAFVGEEACFDTTRGLKRNLKILIKDTGPGIPPELKERIFDPFFTTKPNGVGIGLSISHRIITDHKGSIKLNGEGRGAVFEITLPLPEERVLPDVLNF